MQRDLVLIGGGHAHVHVLAEFALRPEPGVRLTLVTRDLSTPYSGMLPGVIAGLYAPAQARIDLAPLCARASARLVQGEAAGLDRANKRVLCADGAAIRYDVVSVDVGIAPAASAIAGAAEHAIAVKPIGSFLSKFNDLLRSSRGPDGPRRIVVVGGGAGGVELMLSVRARLRHEARAAGQDDDAFQFALVTDSDILATHHPRVRATFRRILTERGIALLERRRVHAITPAAVMLDGDGTLAADAVLLTTGAAAPAWFRGTGLTLDAGGFIAVTPTLQALNDPDVFAAGDCAALVETPREKAGVYAVRAGPPLANNLRRRARGERLKPWRPQRRHLALISTGERYAVASRGIFKAEGACVWRLKDLIDRRWMARYQDAGAAQAY